MLASQNGRLEVVEILLSADAKVNARSGREAVIGGSLEIWITAEISQVIFLNRAGRRH